MLPSWYFLEAKLLHVFQWSGAIRDRAIEDKLAILQKVLTGAIEDMGGLGKRFYVVFEVFTKMHIKKLLL